MLKLPVWNSIRLRLTLLFAGLFLLLDLIASIFLNWFLTEQMLLSKGESIRQLGQGIVRAITVNLTERDREIRLLARNINQQQNLDKPELIRPSLDALQASYPSYAWIGIADAKGVVSVATRGLLEGQNVSKRPWFIHGQHAPFVGDVHEAVLLSKLLPEAQRQGEPLRFVDFTAPLYDSKGQINGVLATHVLWEWVEQTVQGMLGTSHSNANVDVLILDQKRNVISPYAAVGQTKLPEKIGNQENFHVATWPGSGEFLYTVLALEGDLEKRLGWQIIVRQPLHDALATVSLVRNSLLTFELLVTLLLVVMVYQLARRFSQPIEILAQNAIEISQDHEATWPKLPHAVRELQQLSAAFEQMTLILLQKKNELLEVNASLERTVAERTAELSQANQELAQRAELQEQLARRDALTGVANRMAANERLLFEQQRFTRHQHAYSVLMMDIDYFKRINDNYGHAMGDQVLIKTAHVLQHQLRRTDFIARFGGEEFLVILPETNLEGAAQLAEKLRSAMTSFVFAEVGQVTLSLGVAMAGPADDGAESVIRRADEALYQSKHQGRNRVSIAANLLAAS